MRFQKKLRWIAMKVIAGGAKMMTVEEGMAMEKGAPYGETYLASLAMIDTRTPYRRGLESSDRCGLLVVL